MSIVQIAPDRTDGFRAAGGAVDEGVGCGEDEQYAETRNPGSWYGRRTDFVIKRSRIISLDYERWCCRNGRWIQRLEGGQWCLLAGGGVCWALLAFVNGYNYVLLYLMAEDCKER